MDAIEFLKKAHDVSVEHFSDRDFVKKNERDFSLASLYASLFEFSGCISFLLDSRKTIGIPPIFRSLLEAYLDLSNLIDDPNYVNYIKASYFNQRNRLHKEAAKGDKPYLNEIGKESSLKDTLDEEKEKLKELNQKGYKELSIEKKFKRASMKKEYRSIYNLLCLDSHNNYSALIERHGEINRGNLKIVFYKDEPIENFVMYINSTSGILVDASIKIHEYFKSDSLKTFQELNEELQSLRKETGLIS